MRKKIVIIMLIAAVIITANKYSSKGFRVRDDSLIEIRALLKEQILLDKVNINNSELILEINYNDNSINIRKIKNESIFELSNFQFEIENFNTTFITPNRIYFEIDDKKDIKFIKDDRFKMFNKNFESIILSIYMDYLINVPNKKYHNKEIMNYGSDSREVLSKPYGFLRYLENEKVIIEEKYCLEEIAKNYVLENDDMNYKIVVNERLTLIPETTMEKGLKINGKSVPYRKTIMKYSKEESQEIQTEDGFYNSGTIGGYEILLEPIEIRSD